MHYICVSAAEAVSTALIELKFVMQLRDLTVPELLNVSINTSIRDNYIPMIIQYGGGARSLFANMKSSNKPNTTPLRMAPNFRFGVKLSRSFPSTLVVFDAIGSVISPWKYSGPPNFSLALGWMSPFWLSLILIWNDELLYLKVFALKPVHFCCDRKSTIRFKIMLPRTICTNWCLSKFSEMLLHQCWCFL